MGKEACEEMKLIPRLGHPRYRSIVAVRRIFLCSSSTP
jgi:hypothetical protein